MSGNLTTLKDAESHKKLRIRQINPGKEFRRKLNSLGVRAGDLIIKTNNSHLGPVLIKNLSMDSPAIAVGRGIAEKILVSYED